MTLDHAYVAGVDMAAGVHILAEISQIRRLRVLSLNGADVRGINVAARVNVSQKDSHGHGNVSAIGAANHIDEVNAKSLRVADIR